MRAIWIAGLCLLAAPAVAQTYTAELSASQEVPPTSSQGTGMATIMIHGDTADYQITYKGLTGAPTMAHIHGPAEMGKNAGVLVPFKDVSADPIKGSMPITPQIASDIKDGKAYVNIHTEQNKGGEIRGQLKPTP